MNLALVVMAVTSDSGRASIPLRECRPVHRCFTISCMVLTFTLCHQSFNHVCYHAGVADCLASGSKTPQEVADALGISGSADALFRLLRLSTSSGIFAVDRPLRGSDTRFRNNRMSILLRTDHPNSIRPLFMHLSESLLDQSAMSMPASSMTVGPHSLPCCRVLLNIQNGIACYVIQPVSQ